MRPIFFLSSWTNQWASFSVPFLSRFRQVEQERRTAPAVTRAGPSGSSRASNDHKQRMPFSGGNAARPNSRPNSSGNSRNANSNNNNRNNQQASSRGGRGGRRGGGAAIGAVRKPRSNNKNSNMMDIDQGPSGRPVGRFPRTTADDGSNKGGRRGGRGGTSAGRGRGGGRGGSRGGRGGAKKAPLTRDNLDADLDSYMMRDANTAKTTLDADLENYMLGVSDIPQQIGA